MSDSTPADVQPCEHDEDPATCQECIDESVKLEDLHAFDPTPVSAASTTMEADGLDALVERASRPSLATLFQQGKDRGLIQATTTYGETA